MQYAFGSLSRSPLPGVWSRDTSDVGADQPENWSSSAVVWLPVPVMRDLSRPLAPRTSAHDCAERGPDNARRKAARTSHP